MIYPCVWQHIESSNVIQMDHAAAAAACVASCIYFACRALASGRTVRTRRTPDPISSSQALYVVIELLDSSDRDPLCSTARRLHVVSKQCQAAARATLRHLRLDLWYLSLAPADRQGGEATAVLPLELLAACPAVTSWVLHPQQLEVLQPDVVQQLSAAAGRLKQLQVVGAIGKCSDTQQPQAQLQGLARLLRVCGQLEAVDLHVHQGRDTPQEWLLLDPNSTSISTVTGPCLPLLRRWTSSGVSWQLLGHWVRQQQQQQQQQLGGSLRELTLAYHPAPPDISGLTVLTGLVALDLTKCRVRRHSLTTLSHMSSLTRLGLYGGVEEAAAACAVTGLRHLCLYNRPNDDAILPGTRLRVLPSSLSSLQRLSHLSISWCRHLEELPADLGMWLPELEVLEAKGCRFETVPASLTALQHLDVSDSTAQRLTLPAALSGLRDLNLHGARQLTSLSGLGELAALEALDIRSTKIFRRGWDLGPGSLTSLQPLTGLRRLAFTREVFRNDPGLNPASYTVLATLTLLTHLTVGPVTLRTKADALLIRRWRGGIDRDAGLQALASMPPLPHLQELVIGEYVGYNAMAALGPWVAKLTALTQLDLWGNQLGKSGTRQLRRLPVQLRELDLSRTGLEEPPVCLTRLTALEVLHIGREGRLVDLARWRAQSSGSTWWLREG